MANTNTSSPNSLLNSALSAIPAKFRRGITQSYLELKRRYNSARYDSSWDSAGLSAGKFCEAVLRFLQYELSGNSIPFGTHIPNFADECQKLIKLPATTGVESLRVIAPRALIFLYTLRGKRGIGHVGGDVEANEIDASTVMRMCDWIVCELIRVYHSLSLEEAQALVDTLAERNLPNVWKVAGKKRVLHPGLNSLQQTLLLLYSEPETAVLCEDLFEWVEYATISTYKQNVLQKLHKQRLIEYDRETESIYISPLGIQEIEKIISQK
jgi:hypothetical protein